jgi:hypothetical protein
MGRAPERLAVLKVMASCQDSGLSFEKGQERWLYNADVI